MGKLLSTLLSSDERSPRRLNPPDLNALSVTLPPEILDKILMEIPMHRDGHGRQTLIACALVATWWTGPSQRRLFSSVEVDDWNYEQWMNGVVFSRSKAYLLGYVLSLSRCRGPTYGRWGRMEDIPEDSVQYFSALRNLRSLSFFDTAFKHINEERFRPCFSAFRETLTHLSFVSLATSFGAFVTFVNHFPNITSLELSLSVVRPDDGPVPPLSRPLRGKLHVHKTITNCVEFFNRFAMLDPEYEELVIDSSIVFSRTEFVEIALRISPRTVRFLKLIDSLRVSNLFPYPSSKPHPYPTFSHSG